MVRLRSAGPCDGGWRVLVSLWLLLAAAAPLRAAVTIGFFSRDFGESFPHAFVRLSGRPDDAPAGPAIDASYGFTAVSVSPGVLLGPVRGEVDAVDEEYVRRSQRHFDVVLSDAHYRQVAALIDRWRTLAQPSYDLHKRNCVHFVAAIARAIGLAAPDDPRLMLKPRSFLDAVTRDNPGVDTRQATRPPPAAATHP